MEDGGHRVALTVVLIFHAVVAQHDAPAYLGILAAFDQHLTVHFLRPVKLPIILQIFRLVIQFHQFVQLILLPGAPEPFKCFLGFVRRALQLADLSLDGAQALLESGGCLDDGLQTLCILLMRLTAPGDEPVDQRVLLFPAGAHVAGAGLHQLRDAVLRRQDIPGQSLEGAELAFAHFLVPDGRLEQLAEGVLPLAGILAQRLQ